MNRASISTASFMLLGCLTLAPQAAALRVSRDTIPLALAPLGNEHRSLRASFDAVWHRAAGPAAIRADRLALVTFLRGTLIPYAQSEELVLYPVIDSVLGTRGQASALVRDHRAIATRTLELAALVDTDVPAFQREAANLAAVVGQHFSTEEDFVLPDLARKMNGRALQALLARLAAQRVQ